MNKAQTLLIAELLATHGTIAVLRAIAECAAVNAKCESTRDGVYAVAITGDYRAVAAQVALLADSLESQDVRI